MATATYVQHGDSIDHTPGAAVAAGDVVVQGELVGMAKLDDSPRMRSARLRSWVCSICPRPPA
jgi:predicted RecA/RadA family phage recombinase